MGILERKYLRWSQRYNVHTGTLLCTYNIVKDQQLVTEGKKLFKDYEKKKYTKSTHYKTTGNDVIYDEYYPKKSKLIIDEIDKIIARHYGFTEKELDFIINYDIKYRMGDELDNQE